ncbi:DUF3306 domain-containing protein [Caldimonas tepidiphila]|uniref:DUF3306 domain-containing protein n=1 Tax=Caldimonas tepidiphila TaxID=2315841 RepID=UPI000E5A406C|nr:DUF3306 domain-containing protein [Caldimonas tepidiphila]
MSEEGFFSRWARRKSEVREGRAPEEPPKPAPAADRPPAAAGSVVPPAVPSASPEPVPPPGAPAAAGNEPLPLPSMEDVARLTRESDYSAFMRRGVDEDVKRAAMKKLFTDPHYNVMDGLDIYIDDYSKPDPIPLAMLRKMNQSKMLGLFRDEEEAQENRAAVADATSGAAPTQDSPQEAVSQSRAEEADAASAPETETGSGATAAGEHAEMPPVDDDPAPSPEPDAPPTRGA